MDFIYLFKVLLKRKWIIIGSAIIATAVAYLLTRNEAKLYSSSAQVSTGFTVSDEIKVSNNTFNFFEADTKFNNAIVTFTSPTVISLLSYTLILHDLESPKPFRYLTQQQKSSDLYQQVDRDQAIQVFKDKLETMSVLTSFKPEERKLLEFLKLYQYDYNSISKFLDVNRLQRTDYIEIDYKSENPELSAFVVNNVYQDFLRYYKTIRSEKSTESIDTLRSLMEKKKQELDEKNDALRAQGLVNVDIESTSEMDLIKELETNLEEEKSKRTDIYYSLQKVNQKLAGLSDNKSGSDNDELVAIRKEMNDAYAAYLNSNSTDQASFSKYTRLKSEYQSKWIDANGGKSTDLNKNDLLDKKNDLEVDLQAADANIQSYQSKINGIKGNVAVEASKGAEAGTLLKDADMASKEYAAAKEKYNDATDLSSSSVNNFRQVVYGQPAIEPLPSKKIIISGMAGVSAMVITILVIILLTYLDSSVKTPAIFAKVVNLKLISMVSFMDLKHKKLSEIVTNTDPNENYKDKQRDNIFRESIRKLRYEIENSGKKIFLFTSPKKGEGKTTIVQAISYSLSLSKKKILIIDTNFCNNDLTVQLNAMPVLQQILPQQMNGSLVKHVKSLASTISENVFAIGCEYGDYTPSEVLPSENLLHHLHKLTEEYDYIILEGPPLNDFSDSKELAQYVDGVVAVFSATHIIKQLDKESINFFKGLNGKFCGSVLNMVKSENLNSI